MARRYDRRTIFFNQEALYDSVFEERGVTGIRHYDSATFVYPTSAELSNLIKKQHIWKTGDRYFKLAIENYGGAQYWWVIALFNQKPTEANLQVGDLIYIPLPLENVLRVFQGS